MSGVIPEYEWNEIVKTGTTPGYYSSWLGREGDADHGWIFAFDANKSTVLNAYTSSSAVPGTRVTSWKNVAGDTAQQWRMYYTFNGKFFISPVTNKNLFIEIYRTSSSTTVDLQVRCNGYQNNYYEDGEMSMAHIGAQSVKLQLPSRTTNGVYYNSRYLAMGNSSTPINDGANTSKYAVWNNSGSNMYIFDA